jgi:hypothetical protein
MRHASLLSAELFRAWDEDGDGYVSKREFRRGLQLFGLRADPKECNSLYSKFDKDGDGRVEYRELYKMIRGAHKSITGRSPSPPESPTQPHGRLPALQSRPASSKQSSNRDSPPQLISQPLAARAARPTQPTSLSLPSSNKPPKKKPVPSLAPLPPPPDHFRGPLTPSAASMRSPKMSPRSKKLSSLPLGPSAMQRAMAGRMPEASAIDLGSLRRAEDAYRALRLYTHGPSMHGALPSSPTRRAALREQAVALSKAYNKMGMGCLHESPQMSLECLQRALLVSPKEDPTQALSMCNIGAYHLHVGAPSVAIRYLLRAAHADHGVSPEVRGRVRINLSVAHNMESEHFEALECAQEASFLLKMATKDLQDTGSSAASIKAVQVLRAMALHNCCASNEFLGKFSTAQTEARRAYRLAREVLPADDGLVQRLQFVELSVEQKVYETFSKSREFAIR